MKVLITSVPGFGHLGPVIPLAIALKTAGHDVAIATSASMQAAMQSAGLTTLPSGPDWLESEFSHTLANSQPVAGYRNDLGSHVETAIPQLLDDVFAHAAQWSPDVIMSNDFEISGRIVAEKMAIPFVLLSSGPRLPHQLREQWHGPLFGKARELAGLPVTHPLRHSLQWLHLCFTPEWYGFNSGVSYHAAETEHGIRPAVFDNFSQWRSGTESPATEGNLNVLCTLGTVFDKDARILERIVEGVSNHSGNLWITRNKGAPSLSTSDLPENVHIITGRQLSMLMPGMDICISHGGTSTLTTALIHGVKSLLIPQGADQIVNALACAQHRLAVSLMNTVVYDDNADQGRIPLTPKLVEDGLGRLLEDAAYQENTARYRQSLDQLPDMRHAVGLIEQLSSTRTPVKRAQRSAE